MIKLKNGNNPRKLEGELREINKMNVNTLKIHQLKKEKKIDYPWDFEMEGELMVGEYVRKFQLTFRNFDDYETILTQLRWILIVKTLSLMVLFKN